MSPSFMFFSSYMISLLSEFYENHDMKQWYVTPHHVSVFIYLSSLEVLNAPYEDTFGFSGLCIIVDEPHWYYHLKVDFQ